MPLARDVVRAVAADHGVCLRPVAMRRIDTTTGETTIVPVPCGATLASRCASCADRNRRLRMQQCREGWHLDREPELVADPPDADQKSLAGYRADLDTAHTNAVAAGDTGDAADVVREIGEVDAVLADHGVRGSIVPSDAVKPRRVRSTRRRQDAPNLPRRRVEPRTVGRVYTAPDGQAWRPSIFLTLTLPSYGRVRSDGAPVDPDRYDYQRAARDCLHFAALVDRFWQNLRRCVGWDVQYFAVVEPQRRLAPHLHAAIRGTIPRAVLRQVAAATYHQVWWPAALNRAPVYDPSRPPLWDPDQAAYVDPDTRATLTTWDDALDQADTDGPGAQADAEPVHVARFGDQVDARGVVAGTPDADRRIGYLAKYLTKTAGDCHTPTTDAQAAHLDRLADALRWEPCSPRCPNWLLHGVQPRDARPGQSPGRCPGRAHRRDTLGLPGRRVLVSRKWTAKTLTDHRADRRDHVLGVLAAAGQPVDTDADRQRWAWEKPRPSDPDTPPAAALLLRAVAERARWQRQYRHAQDLAAGHPSSATDARAA
jgi:hypothetical protein